MLCLQLVWSNMDIQTVMNFILCVCRLWPWAVRSWWRSRCWAGRRLNMRLSGTSLTTASQFAIWRTSTHWAFIQVPIKRRAVWFSTSYCALQRLCCSFARLSFCGCLVSFMPVSFFMKQNKLSQESTGKPVSLAHLIFTVPLTFTAFIVLC